MDRLRVLPYPADELIASIALVATFLIGRAEKVRGVDGWAKLFFGKLKTVEIAPIGGHIEAGSVSEADLIAALSGEHVGKMTAYMQRKAAENPEFPMLYIVDHFMIYDFARFRKIFAEQFIPTAVDWYWKEDLNLNKGALECMWSINFNPALLGYVTPFEFRFGSPIAAEKDCSQIVYVLPDTLRARCARGMTPHLKKTLDHG